jgi:hypothetical protein
VALGGTGGLRRGSGPRSLHQSGEEARSLPCRSRRPRQAILARISRRT